MTISIPKLATPRLRISEIDLCAWLGQALPGDVLEYHRGFLTLDSAPQSGRLSERDRVELLRVGGRAWWAADRGLVHLVQRRHGLDDYSYLAIARRRPRAASIALSSLLMPEVA